MKIGLQVSVFTWEGGPSAIAGTLAEIARTAEAAGFHSLWLMDHYFQIPPLGPPELDMLEAYTALGFCAAVTSRIKLGTMATGIVYRHPGILLKTVTTLDVLSGGRAYLGIGAAWFEQEAKGLGVPFPPIATRFELLEEVLQAARQMWSDDTKPFDGKHLHLAQPLCRPQPLSKPHPPILVAGSGEKKTLRLVAQYGDACNIYGDADQMRPKLDILKRHCESVGRDYGEIEITNMSTLPAETDAIIAHCKALADVGVHHAIFSNPSFKDLAALEAFGRDVILAVAAF
jgi:F420-dependent oxidoreductase-like protein